MKHQETLQALLALALLLGPLLKPAMAQNADPADEIARLKSDIARLKKEAQHADADLQRTDSLSREENAAASQNLDRWKRDKERRDRENQALAGRIQETRSKIAAEQSRMRGYLNGVEEIKAHDKALLKIFSELADSLLASIESGPPWDMETRRDRILSLKRDLEAGSATPDEAFGRLAAILKEEIKSGDEVALFNRPLTRQNGEVINAQILKLGNQALMYMDEEGKKFGVMENHIENGKSVHTWREEISFEEKNAIKLALSVKAGKEAPQLVPLSLSLPSNQTTPKGDR